MSRNKLPTTNQSTKLTLSKSKSLLNIANKLLSKKDVGQIIQNFKFKPFIREREHSDYIESVAISPDGKTIVSGSFKGTINILDMQSGEYLNTLEVHIGYASVAISPDGKTIVSGSEDNTIQIWDMQSGGYLNTLEGYPGIVESIAISPDGKTIVSGGGNKTIKIWDMQSGTYLDTLEGHSGRVYSVAISPDGKTIVSGSGDKTIKIWDIQSGTCLHTLEGHSYDVYSVVISPDGKTIVSGSEDNTIQIWDIQSGECIYTSDNTAKISIDKDGYFVGEMVDIVEYVRVSESPLSQRRLTDEEIKYFRKRGNFLEVGEIVPKPQAEEIVIKKRKIPIIDIDEDEIPF